jgi:hypothetical protein
VVPHANIRQIHSAWVRDLREIFKQHGWSERHPVVYASVPFEEMKSVSALPENCKRARLACMSFMILDGAPRINALRRLQETREAARIGPDFLIEVYVLPEQTSVVERAIDAIAQNKAETHALPKRRSAMTSGP